MTTMMVAWLFASPGFAGDKACTETQLKCVELDFEAANISARRAAGDLEWVSVRRAPLAFNPLITIRSEFNHELRGSLTQVR